MPYSIVTKDGITIDNIPDTVDRNSDELKQRVAGLRADRDGGAVAPMQVEAAPQQPKPDGFTDDARAVLGELAAASGKSVPDFINFIGADGFNAILKRQAQGPSFIDKAVGVVETVGAIGSAAAAEPIAGMAGIAQTLNPFVDSGAGVRAVEGTREALSYQPRTREGKDSLGAVASALEPVAEVFSDAEDYLGDKVFEKTESPALAAAATTIPTVIAELVGVAAGKGVLKIAKGRKGAATSKAVAEAAPTIDQLQDASRAVYKEIDSMGVSIKASAYKKLVKKLHHEAKSSGLDPDITPKATKALQRFSDLSGSEVTLTELDTLRKVAKNAAGSLERADASLGMGIANTVDEFLDAAGVTALKRPKGSTKGVGVRYKAARDLWGRARKSELLEESFEKARNQASGFENGVRVQFRAILNNKKKRRFFKAEELEAMTTVVRGTKAENFAKLVGRLGFSEGGATNIIGGALGASAGGVMFGTPGAVAVPLIGQVSRKLAQRLTVKNAEFANQVVRAGKDAKKIASAYLENTAKANRSPEELSQLLMQIDFTPSKMPTSAFSRRAAEIAMKRKATGGGVTAGAATATTVKGSGEDER